MGVRETARRASKCGSCARGVGCEGGGAKEGGGRPA